MIGCFNSVLSFFSCFQSEALIAAVITSFLSTCYLPESEDACYLNFKLQTVCVLIHHMAIRLRVLRPVFQSDQGGIGLKMFDEYL